MTTDTARDQTPSQHESQRFLVRRDQDDPRWWLATWDEDERVHTFGRSLTELQELARDALALWLHADPGDVSVTLDVDLPEDVRRDLTQLTRLRGELDSVQSAVLRRQRHLARELVENQGMTYRDAAQLLNISHQRIAQLVKESA